MRPASLTWVSMRSSDSSAVTYITGARPRSTRGRSFSEAAGESDGRENKEKACGGGLGNGDEEIRGLESAGRNRVKRLVANLVDPSTEGIVLDGGESGVGLATEPESAGSRQGGGILDGLENQLAIVIVAFIAEGVDVGEMVTAAGKLG